MADFPPRRRSSRPEWTSQITDRLTPTVRAIVIVDLVVYLFYVLTRNARAFMEMHLALGPGVFVGEIWQPITSLFTHISLLGFLFNMIGLWYVGGLIERERGRGRFLALFLGGGVLANLATAAAWHLRGYGPIPFDDGCSFAVIALCVAFARIYGRHPVQFWPTTLMIQARYLILIMVGLGAASIAAQQQWHLLAGMVVAIVVGYFGVGAGGMTQLRDFFANVRAAARARQARRRFGVIEGGSRPPKKKYVN
jgi:membrane associated rhomboid family serine protease